MVEAYDARLCRLSHQTLLLCQQRLRWGRRLHCAIRKPCDCQAKAAATPMQNAIRNGRGRARLACERMAARSGIGAGQQREPPHPPAPRRLTVAMGPKTKL